MEGGGGGLISSACTLKRQSVEKQRNWGRGIMEAKRLGENKDVGKQNSSTPTASKQAAPELSLLTNISTPLKKNSSYLIPSDIMPTASMIERYFPSINATHTTYSQSTVLQIKHIPPNIDKRGHVSDIPEMGVSVHNKTGVQELLRQIQTGRKQLNSKKKRTGKISYEKRKDMHSEVRHSISILQSSQRTADGL